MDDLSLIRQLAELMGWRIYTEEAGEYDQWQRMLVAGEGANTCFIDLDGIVWRHTGTKYTSGEECAWLPLLLMDDAIATLQHFAECHACNWRIYYLSHRGFVRLHGGPYGCTIFGGDLEYDTPLLEISRHAPTPARAICLALVHARTAGGDDE